MDIKFTNSVCTSLKPVLREVAAAEQTQEIKVTDGMPDIGRVIGAWGQSILRSKEWHLDHIQCMAGMMVWVLYAPEDGSEPRMMNTWIPFQFRWELPDGTPEGKMIIQCLTRFADARSVSPRKMIVRCAMSALAQGFVPDTVTTYSAESDIPGVEILRTKYPVRVRKESGEKILQLDEELVLPESAPKLDNILYCFLEPQLQDGRVLADKLVFRGNAKLHVLYRSQDGQVHSWDFSMPFSQYAVLDESYGADARPEIYFCITGLETDFQENGTIRVKCGMVCQYLICDRKMLEIVEDAYNLKHELEVQKDIIRPNVILDRKKEKLYPEQTVNAEANIVPDVQFLPDFPKSGREGDEVKLLWPGNFRVLYYGTDGQLYSSTVHWEGQWKTNLDSNAAIQALPGQPEAQAAIGSGTVTVSAEYPVEMEAWADQEIHMVTGIEMGQPLKQDPVRPSLVLKRAGEQSLWELAKNNGSTVDAIRRANGLQEEPVGNQMLLIPVLP